MHTTLVSDPGQVLDLVSSRLILILFVQTSSMNRIPVEPGNIQTTLIMYQWYTWILVMSTPMDHPMGVRFEVLGTSKYIGLLCSVLF